VRLSGPLSSHTAGFQIGWMSKKRSTRRLEKRPLPNLHRRVSIKSKESLKRRPRRFLPSLAR